MSGPVDSRAVVPYQPMTLPLGAGLDQTSPAGKAAPGSLADCLNVEVVDGYLQECAGVLPMGDILLNGTYPIYILCGEDGVDYVRTGSLTMGGEVRWYEDSTNQSNPLGIGYWWYQAGTSTEFVAITGVTGAPPTGDYYFHDSTNGESITISDDEFRFALPSPTYTRLTYAIWNAAVTQISTALSTDWTWDAMRPSPLAMNNEDAAISHIFQANDTLYCVQDFAVIGFQAGTEKPDIGDKIHIDYPNATGPICYVAHVEEYSESSFSDGNGSGWLYLYPQSDSTLDPTKLDNIYGYAHPDVIQNLTTGNALGKCAVQTSPASVKTWKHHGLLWKLDTTSKVNGGWSWIHPGYHAHFENLDTTRDQTAPVSDLAPLFVTDSISRLKDTGYVAFNTPTESPSSGTTYTAWANLANMAADDTTYASNAIGGSKSTRELLFTIPTSTAIDDDAKITGIEVQFEAYASAVDSVYPSLIQLRNDGTDVDSSIFKGQGCSWDLSRFREGYVATSPTVYTFGGDLDLWGLESIPAVDWNAQDIRLVLQFRNENIVSRTLYVDYVWIKVHYSVRGQHVYFRSNVLDATEGVISAYQVMDGDWSTDDAKGWLTFDSIDDPSAVYPGSEIWTGPGGTGDFIGNVSYFGMNLLPSNEEMVASRTRPRTVVSSLGSEEGEETAYNVNGVGPAWALDADERLRFIRTPVSPEKDKPRYVEVHRNHLCLGLKEHMMVSSVASPDNMNTADGATAWNLNDRITGMHHTTDGTTVILCKDSIHQFQGAAASGSDPFAMTTITNKGGAKDYSSQEMGDIYFMTSSGLSSVSATDKFGNFDAATLSHGIEEWIRNRLRTPHDTDGKSASDAFVDSMVVKSKNQIRYFFNDGHILTATFPVNGEGLPAFTFQNYSADWVTGKGADGSTSAHAFQLETYEQVPTALFSGFSSWGEEKLYFGRRHKIPSLLRLDQGSMAYRDAGTKMARAYGNAYFELNPIMLGDPFTTPSHLERTGLTWDAHGPSHIFMFTDVDFKSPDIKNLWTSAGDAIHEPYKLHYLTGTTLYPYIGRRQMHYSESFIQNIANSHTITVATFTRWGHYNGPTRFIDLTLYMQPRSKKARLQQGTSTQTTQPKP